jgi:hypothetical protein
LVAITEQRAACETVNTADVTVHPVPETSYVTAPVPDPPVVVRVMDDVVATERVVLEIRNGVWGSKAAEAVMNQNRRAGLEMAA